MKHSHNPSLDTRAKSQTGFCIFLMRLLCLGKPSGVLHPGQGKSNVTKEVLYSCTHPAHSYLPPTHAFVMFSVANLVLLL